MNCGWSSGFFKLGRGVRQGCPISPYLFLICSEILGIGIRNYENVKGIKINGDSYKIVQFADDTQILLDGSQNSLNAAIKTLKEYEQLSGMKINFDKSKIARLGQSKHTRYANENNIKLTDAFLKVLGIKIPLNGNSEELISLNYDPLLEKIREIISKWSKRKLSLNGKAVIIKSLILPQLIYQLTNLNSPPNKFLQSVDNAITDFLWDNKKHKISRKQLYLNYDEGGLKIPNVFVYAQSLKLKWIKFLADEDYQSDWKQIFLNKNKPFTDFLLKSNICQSDIKKLNIVNKFWVEVLEIWSKIHCKHTEDMNCQSEHPQFFLWFNNKIKINGKTVFYKPWYLAGVKYVKNLMDDEGVFYNYEQFKEKYNFDVNFLQFHGIINSVRALVNFDGVVLNIDPILRKLLTVKSSSQAFYQLILKDINILNEIACLDGTGYLINSLTGKKILVISVLSQ